MRKRCASSASPGPTTSCHQPPRGSSGNQTRRDAEMPPIATTTGAPAGPARRHAIETDSSAPPKCSLISPGTASTPSRTCTPLTTATVESWRLNFVLSLLTECSNPCSTQRGTRYEPPCGIARHPDDPGMGEEAAHLPDPAFFRRVVPQE